MAARWGAIVLENAYVESSRSESPARLSTARWVVSLTLGPLALVGSVLLLLLWVGPYNPVCLGGSLLVPFGVATSTLLAWRRPLRTVGYDLTQRGILRHREDSLAIDEPTLKFFPLDGLQEVVDRPGALELAWADGQRWVWPKEQIPHLPQVETYFFEHMLLRGA